MKGMGNRQKRVVVPKRIHVVPKPPKSRGDQPPRRPGSRPQPARNAGLERQPRKPGE
jgi:hypothetical protein